MAASLPMAVFTFAVLSSLTEAYRRQNDLGTDVVSVHVSAQQQDISRLPKNGQFNMSSFGGDKINMSSFGGSHSGGQSISAGDVHGLASNFDSAFGNNSFNGGNKHGNSHGISTDLGSAFGSNNNFALPHVNLKGGKTNGDTHGLATDVLDNAKGGKTTSDSRNLKDANYLESLGQDFGDELFTEMQAQNDNTSNSQPTAMDMDYVPEHISDLPEHVTDDFKDSLDQTAKDYHKGARMSAGVLIAFVVFWLGVSVAVPICVICKLHTPGNEIGITSVLCAVCCAPGGCLALFMPIDKPKVGPAVYAPAAALAQQGCPQVPHQ